MSIKPLSYIIRKSIKNRLKLLRKKPVQLIAYTIFFSFLILSLFMSKRTGGNGNFITEDLFGSIVTGLILLFTVPDLLTSLNNGSTFFRGADVNLVFTAPIRPQNILIYGFIKQIYTVLITLIFLFFQIPNLYQFKNIKPYSAFLIMGAMFILMFANSINKILLYSVASKNERLRRIINDGFKVLGTLLIGLYFIILYLEKSPIKAVYSILNNKFLQYIPVYGWSRNLFMASINGISISTIIYGALMIMYILLCIFILYTLNLDYYEDVLGATELKEKLISAKRNKGEKFYYNRGKKEKTRKVKYERTGNYASAIFFRHLLEYKKTGYGFINITSVIYMVIAFSVGLFSPVKDIRIVLGLSIYLLMIFSFANKWQQELTRPYIFMIPDSSFKKVVFSTLLDNIKNLIDGIIIFLITGFFFKTPLLIIILCILAFASVGSLFVYGGVFTKRFLGTNDNIVFTSLMRLLLLLLIVLPGMIVFGILTVTFDKSMGGILAYLILIVYNLMFSSLIILFSKGIFENIEI